MTPEEIKKLLELRSAGPYGVSQTNMPRTLKDITGPNPNDQDAALLAQLEMLNLLPVSGKSLAGGQAPSPTTTMEDMTVTPASEYPPDVTAAQGNAPRGSESMDFTNQPSGLEGQPKTGGAGWTNAATLALANSMPELIKAAYQRPERPQGRSVGGGKPSFQMIDPFAGKKDKYRSLLAQYLR